MHVAGLGPIRGLKDITLRVYREQGIKGLYAGKPLGFTLMLSPHFYNLS